MNAFRHGDFLKSGQPLLSRPVTALAGVLRVPGDKSISHRALILGLLSIGDTVVDGLLDAEDISATADAVRALGGRVKRSKNSQWHITGVGVGGLCQPQKPLDFGNSGTAARLIMGLVASHPIVATFTGDASLSRRPMARVLTPLLLFGADTGKESGDRLPLTITGAREPVPITYELPVASAQIKSAILLAGLNTPGVTTVIETTPSRDHTERMLAYFGADISRVEKDGKHIIKLRGYAELQPKNIIVPGDPSSAAFAMVAALITPRSDIVIENVLLNPTRRGLIDTLIEMGGSIDIENERDIGSETAGDIRVRSSTLKGVRVPAARAPSMIDEYPALAVAAAFAHGPTQMTGIGELRVKESDRLAAIADGLKSCGIPHQAGADDLTVMPAGTVPGGGIVKTHMDHRIAMAFLTLGLGADHAVGIDECAMIATSYPDFVADMTRLGAQIEPGGAGP